MAEAKAKSKTTSSGFGFEAKDAAYHYLVRLRADGTATIIERYDDDVKRDTVKALVTPERWTRIADQVAQDFNHRLIAEGMRSGRWLKDETKLAPYFGKEVTLLAWAIEDADLTLLPAMVANWRGLAPEERWWFYTTINAAGGDAWHGRDKGWRQAIKIAFADNPVHVAPTALLHSSSEVAALGAAAKAKRASKKAPSQGALRLFDDLETSN